MTQPLAMRCRQAAYVAGVTVSLLSCGTLHAQNAPPAARPSASPAKPAATPTPHVIRPTATLGPAAPGTTPGEGAPAEFGQQPASSAAGNAPRPAGVPRFLSVSTPDAVMFDAPSDKAKKIFLAPGGMPVEVVSVLRAWVKVRDPLGDLAWIRRDSLSDRRMVMATAIAVMRREARSDSTPWFSVDRGVVVELLEERPINGFLKVRHEEGQIGFIHPAQVWGQ